MFTLDELGHALRSLKQGKAPGLDLVDVGMARVIQQECREVLLRLYNTCTKFGIFTDKWKNTQVVFFVKKGKDARQSSAYKPICLLPVLGKVLKKLIKIRLACNLESTGYMRNAQ